LAAFQVFIEKNILAKVGPLKIFQ